MSAYPSEFALVEQVSEALVRSGHDVFLEVPLMSRCVDIVAVHRESGNVSAIECKLRDWKRAMTQARSHAIACDSVAICIPHREASAALLESCKSVGVGLMMIDADTGTLRNEVEAERTGRVWAPAREWLDEQLRLRGAAS